MGISTKISAGDWLETAKMRLEGSETPSLEAQLLLAHVLEQPRPAILAHLDQKLEPAHLAELERLLAQLEEGVPLAYLLGEKEFYGMSFRVSPAVLIPRPETELLVDTALEWLRTRPGRRLAADVGTGSGCIAAALAAHITDLRVLAVDRSREALEVARENFRRYGLFGLIHLVQGDLLSSFTGPFDLVCANLPYIPRETLRGLEVARHEPLSALDGGADGLELIGRLLADAPRWTLPGSLILLEIEAGQGKTALVLAQHFFPSARIEVANDLAGHPRLLKIQL
jgi:release factor glutamine methyltransferase